MLKTKNCPLVLITKYNSYILALGWLPTSKTIPTAGDVTLAELISKLVHVSMVLFLSAIIVFYAKHTKMVKYRLVVMSCDLECDSLIKFKDVNIQLEFFFSIMKQLAFGEGES